jgi:hypothetical protein
MRAVEHRFGGQVTRRAAQALLAGLTLVAAAAAVSEGAVALGVVGLSASDGTWSLRDVVLATAVLALFFGGPVVAALASTPVAGAVARLVPPAALATAAAVVARYYAYDPYYAPYLRRMSDGGALPTWWIAVVAAIAIFAAARARNHPQSSLVLAGVAMFLAGPTLLVAGAGH